MIKPGRWYRSLSLPSRLLLLVCLGLCLIFSVELVGHLREYLEARAELEWVEGHLDRLLRQEERLKAAQEEIDIIQDQVIQEDLPLASPGHTLVSPDTVPPIGVSETADEGKPTAPLPPWRRWWNLFFGPPPERAAANP